MSEIDDPGQFPPQFRELIAALFPGHADEMLLAMQDSQFDPTQLMQAAGLPQDPAALEFALSKIRQALQGGGDQVVNWEMAHDLARQAASEGGDDPTVTAAETETAQQSLSVAELWLDQATVFPAAGGAAAALSGAEWIELTLPTWQRLVDPIATSVARVLGEAITRHGRGLEEEVNAGLSEMMRTMGGAAFGMQLGQAIGGLAREVIGLTEIGLPLTKATATALLPASIRRFSKGLELPEQEVWLFLAVREAAGARLFTHARWLPAYLIGTVEAYARGIEIDVDAIEMAVRELDPSDPEELRRALSGGVFTPARSAAQQAALTRLETALALVEGWVDEVTGLAVADRLPSAQALAEMVRRRRAAGGPAERAFGSLVGLELRPRQAREAARLWRAVDQADGHTGRERIWSHPDLLPTAEDLASPQTFPQIRAAQADADAAVDAAIAELLSDQAD